MKYITLILIICLSFNSCDYIYKAGNRTKLMGILIETKVNNCVIRKHIDSVIYAGKLSFPDSLNQWLILPSDVQYIPEDNKILYFRDSPEELYQLSIDGDLRLQGVHRSKKDEEWIYEKSELSKKELERIISRINTSILIPLVTLKDTCN